MLAADWIAAWNAKDLDAILAHYADGVEFVSPVAPRMGIADGVVRGKAALRAYFARGLAAAPDLRFDLLDELRGPSGITLYYRNHRGQTVAETMLLDEGQRVVRAFVHYGRA